MTSPHAVANFVRAWDDTHPGYRLRIAASTLDSRAFTDIAILDAHSGAVLVRLPDQAILPAVAVDAYRALEALRAPGPVPAK